MGPSLFVVVTERGVRQNRDFPLRALAVARRQSVVPEDTRSPILRRARSANDRRPLALGQRTVQHTASRHHFHVRLVPHRGMMNSEERSLGGRTVWAADVWSGPRPHGGRTESDEESAPPRPAQSRGARILRVRAQNDRASKAQACRLACSPYSAEAPPMGENLISGKEGH